MVGGFGPLFLRTIGLVDAVASTPGFDSLAPNGGQMFFFSLAVIIITAVINSLWSITVAAFPIAFVNSKMVFIISDLAMGSSKHRKNLLLKQRHFPSKEGMKEEFEIAEREVWLCEMFEVICWSLLTAIEIWIIKFTLGI